MSKAITQVRYVKCKNEYNEEDHYCSAGWELNLLDETRVYFVNNKYGDTSTINLSDKELLYVYPGTKFILLAYMGKNEWPSEVYIEYSPDSNLTAYFTATGDYKNNQLVYEGTW